MPYATRLGRNPAFRGAYAAFTAITLLNFFAFSIVAHRLGGDAVYGKAEGGRYYVFGDAATDGQKVYTEVSQTVYNYSRWHVYSLFVTWPLMMAGALFMRRKSPPSAVRSKRVFRRAQRRLARWMAKRFDNGE